MVRRRTRKRRGGVGLGRGGINSPKIPSAPAQNKPDWMKQLQARKKARASAPKKKTRSKLKGPPSSAPPPPPTGKARFKSVGKRVKKRQMGVSAFQRCPVGCRPKSAAGGRRRRSRRRRRRRRSRRR